MVLFAVHWKLNSSATSGYPARLITTKMERMHNMIAIPTKVADLVRKSMKSPGYGHPAHTEVATGYGPCRHCLQFFRQGEDARILFTYDPFHELDRPLPGPVFIHAESCTRYPENAGFPEHLALHPLTIKAYGAERKLIEHLYVEDGGHQHTIEKLLANAEIRYLLVYDTDAGCYDFRIERR